MRTTLPLAFCLLLIAPAALNVADEGAKSPAEKAAEPPASSLRQFSEDELSAARKSLADLTPEQRALVNHLRYLMRPQYEEELMLGRAFAPSPLQPFEQPGTELETPDVLRLWAVLATGLPTNDSTRLWLRQFINMPVPSGVDGLGEIGLHMAVCAHGATRADIGLADELKARAEELVDAAEKSRRITDERSPLIVGKTIDPKWYANHLWRALINRFALQLELNIHERLWETAVRDLLGARHDERGWTSKSGGNSEVEDLDANLFAIAALSLAHTAPEGVIGSGLARSLERALEDAPELLKRLDADFAGAVHNGSRLAVSLTLSSDLAPAGSDAATWRAAFVKRALDNHDPSGAMLDGAAVGRELGLATGRRSLRVCETALQCVALSGGLLGGASPLSSLELAQIARAMHACSVLHANELPEGYRRVVYAGEGHDLPEPRAMEKFMLSGIDYLVDLQGDDGGWGSSYGSRGGKSTNCDPGTTAFVAMALVRAGHTPFGGEHREVVLEAVEYVLNAVEEAEEDGPRITGATGTQLQGKLGQIVDTAVVTQFLARMLPVTESDRELNGRVADALEKCIRKIEESQGEEGGWITQGWAPVLQSAMFNQALELAQLAGCEVDFEVLHSSRAYLARDVDIDGKKTEAAGKARVSAGIAFYAGSSALRATAGDAAEVTIVMEQAKKNRTVSSTADVSDAALRAIGYSESDAIAKATAYKQYHALIAKLDDEKYLKGFGNNGGEEFISYMLSSESLVITGHDKWDKWNDKLYETFEKIQNKDGSWSGHHCISSPVLCTAAVLMTLTADREVHVVVETGPRDRTTSSKKDDDKSSKKSTGPTTGK